VVVAGTPQAVAAAKTSYTGHYLRRFAGTGYAIPESGPVE
jgi:excinuclease UvrABC ATPase subunit